MQHLCYSQYTYELELCVYDSMFFLAPLFHSNILERKPQIRTEDNYHARIKPGFLALSGGY